MASHAKVKKKQKKKLLREIMDEIYEDDDSDLDVPEKPVIVMKKKKTRKISTFEESLDPDKSQLDACLYCACGCCEGCKKLSWACFKYSFKLIVIIAVVSGIFALYVAANMVIAHGPSATYWVSTTMDKVRGKTPEAFSIPPNEIPIRTVPPMPSPPIPLFNGGGGGGGGSPVTNEPPKKMEM
jgi:hypothetical protein